MHLDGLAQLRLVRLVSAPDLGDDPSDHRRLVPPLVSAHALAHPVVIGWSNVVLSAPGTTGPPGGANAANVVGGPGDPGAAGGSDPATATASSGVGGAGTARVVAGDGVVVFAGAPAGGRSFPFPGVGSGDGPAAVGQRGGVSEVSGLFPPGSRVVPLDSVETVAALAGLGAWTSLAAEPASTGRGQPGGGFASGPGGGGGGRAPAPGSNDRSARPRGTEPSDRTAAGGFEDVALHLLDVPFAWLVLAEPVSADDVDDHFRAVQSAARSLTNAAQQPGAPALDLAVATALLEHLHRGRSVGLWRVRVLAGSTTAAQAREVAELLAAASVLHEQPLRLVPTGFQGALGELLVNGAGGGADAEHDAEHDAAPTWSSPRRTFVTTSDHLAVLARPPSREVPGFRLTLPQAFDSNVELPRSARRRPADASTPLPVGVLLDQWERPRGDYGIAFDALNRHMFVCGATGSGKSQTIRQLLEELSGHGVPWLVIEPVKAEYRRMADRLAAAGVPVHVIRLGAADQPPCMLNPLEPEAGFNVQTHVDMVTALFLASFDAEEPFPQVLSESLRRCYEDLGWDLATGRYKPALYTPVDDGGDSFWSRDLASERQDPRPEALDGGEGPGPDDRPRYPTYATYPTYPTLTELQAVADEVVKGVGYGPEVQANVRGFIKVRLGSLRLGTPGRFFESGHPLDVGRMLDGNVVVELEDVGNDQDKAFVIGAVLLRVVEHLRVNRVQSDVLQHVTVIEEAHRLLRRPERSGPANHAIETFAGLLAEVRAYGEGLVVAEQIPTKIVPDVVKNTAVQVMHRLPARDDRELVGGAMNMTPEQMDYVVGLHRGQAAVFSEGMDRPVLVAMRLGVDREGGGEHARPAIELLAGRRSPCCPELCRAAPCTISDMQTAAARARALRGLDLYVELALASLLRPGGEPVAPADDLVTAVRRWPERERDCALGQVAQDAVRRRRALLAEYADPSAVLGALVGFLHDIFGEAGAAATLWVDRALLCRLPKTLDQRVRIATYVGGDVGELQAMPGVDASRGRRPLLDLARECLAENQTAPAQGLAPRLGPVLGAAGPRTDELVSLLVWCFGWPA